MGLEPLTSCKTAVAEGKLYLSATKLQAICAKLSNMKTRHEAQRKKAAAGAVRRKETHDTLTDAQKSGKASMDAEAWGAIMGAPS